MSCCLTSVRYKSSSCFWVWRCSSAIFCNRLDDDVCSEVRFLDTPCTCSRTFRSDTSDKMEILSVLNHFHPEHPNKVTICLTVPVDDDLEVVDVGMLHWLQGLLGCIFMLLCLFTHFPQFSIWLALQLWDQTLKSATGWAFRTLWRTSIV